MTLSIMGFMFYQHEAMRTKAHYMSKQEQIINGALGLAGEGGEVCDLIKKHLAHGHILQVEDVEKELGDILWYIAEICDALGLDMGIVARKNIEKLVERYPQGFSTEKSLNRKEYAKQNSNSRTSKDDKGVEKEET